MRQPSILVVDDDPINYDVIEAILDGQGYALHYAASGLEAIGLLTAVEPDLILMDVMMPGIDGVETCKRIKCMPQWLAIPIVMVTALDTKEDLAECIAAGAEDFLSKPVNPIELRARTHSMLRIKGQYDNIKALTQLQANTIQVLQDSLDALRRNLVASLPHELNTPLHGISGIISVLLEQHDSMDSEETLMFLDLARQSVLRLEKFIQRFLVYFELEMAASKAGNCGSRGGKRKGYIHAKPIIEACAKKQAEIADRAADLQVSADDAVVAANPVDLQFITEELLENAFKFSPPGTPVRLACGLAGDGFRLSVSDQGRGMTAGQIAKIGAFMQFERKQYEQQGSGLGLAIVKRIIEAQGGGFSIESVYHRQTTIHVRLPCVPKA